MSARKLARQGSAVTALAVLGALLAQPATNASNGDGLAPGQALRQQLQQKAAHAAGSTAREGDEDGGDEADEILARAKMEGLITTAPATDVSSGAMAAATRQAAALPKVGGSWNEITDKPFLNDPVPGRGPTTLSNYGVNWGLVTGRMTALTTSGSAVYAGAADGGVWKSTDRGAHWRQWSTGLPRMAIGALRTNPADGSVWAGLGEANTNFDAANGMGVFRLARGAGHWVRVGGGEMTSRNTYELRFIGDYAFAATSKGLWRHSAATPSAPWHLVLKPDPNPAGSPYRTSHVTSVVAVPGSGGAEVLANVGWRGGTKPEDTAYNGFYVSASGGAPGSFHRVKPAGDINNKEIGRTTFDTAGTAGPIYAVIEDSVNISLLGQGVFVSPSGNPTGPWRKLAGSQSLANSGSALGEPPGYFPGVQAWYNQYVHVDPKNPKHVYLGLEEVFETTDGGKTWFAIGAYWDFGIKCATDFYTCPPTTHPDQHALTIADDGQVYAGSDGGVWRRSITEHGRRGWVNLNRTLHTLQYYSVAIGAKGGSDRIWGGLQDNGETYDRTGTSPLLQVFTGDGGDTIVNPEDGDAAVVEYVYASQALTTDAGRHYREIGVSCLATLTRDPIEGCDPNPRFIAPLEQDVTDPSHWITGGQFIWTDNKGWDTVCNLKRCDWRNVHDLGDGNSATALAKNGSTIYAGYCGGLCNKNQGPFVRGVVTNAGGAWHDITAGLPNRYVTALTVDPGDARHVFATLGSYQRRWIPGGGVGHVFESRNAGRTWHDISGNLPDTPALQLVLWRGHVVVATDVGVFSAAAGTPTTWSRLGGGMPRVRVWDLKVDPGRDYLVAATHGRGMFKISTP